MKKLLAVGVIVLFLGLAIAPSINANVSKASIESEMVEITTEVCGINGVTPNTVLLSKEDAEEVEALFDSIRERLNATETREDTEQIFKEAVVELDKYGLLGGLSVRQAQRMAIYPNFVSKQINLLERMIYTHRELIDENENHLCLVAGRTTDTWFENLGTLLCYRLMDNNINNIIISRISFIGYLLFSLFSYFNPFAISYRINYGKCRYEHEMSPIEYYASGWVYTIGIKGIKTWQDNMQGTLPIEGTSLGGFGTLWYDVLYPGAVGFTGVKITLDNEDFYIGSALWVKIGNEPPY